MVTGVNAEGRSVITSDGPAPSESTWGSTGGEGADFWLLHNVPVDLSDSRDPVATYKKQEWPPTSGALVRVGTWQPGYSYPMHRSATVDVCFIISGQIELLLDDGSATLGPGDCCVQRSTNHGWRVVGNEPCTWAAVVIGAKP